MKSKTLRVVIPLVVILVISVGFMLNTGVGTLSAFGWGDISLLCPLGALGTMLASKMLVPKALISLVIAICAIVLLGRAFCGWICPVPLVSKLRDLFKKNPKDEVKETSEKIDAEEKSVAAAASKNATETAVAPASPTPLTDAEKSALQGCKGTCSSCSETKAKFDSRHIVLGGSLLSAAIFGFPVFCLICPIGLTFATILLLILLFSNGDVTWSVIVVPALLLAEVVFFRKWCSKICPLSAFMSLVGKLNKTFRPAIDDTKCLETSRNATCGACAKACEQGIDPRHPEQGASWSECTKCRACIDACPTQAISMPLLACKQDKQEETHQPEPVE